MDFIFFFPQNFCVWIIQCFLYSLYLSPRIASRNQDRLDRCAEDIQFGVYGDGRCANCVSARVFNTGYHFVDLCRIHCIYNPLLCQFDSHLKRGY